MKHGVQLLLCLFTAEIFLGCSSVIRRNQSDPGETATAAFWLRQGRIAEHNDLLEEAEQYYRYGLHTNEANITAALALARVLKITSHEQDAYKLYRWVYRQEPRNAEARTGLGWIHFSRGHIEKAARLTPQTADTFAALHLLGAIKQYQGQDATAAALLRRARKLAATGGRPPSPVALADLDCRLAVQRASGTDCPFGPVSGQSSKRSK